MTNETFNQADRLVSEISGLEHALKLINYLRDSALNRTIHIEDVPTITAALEHLSRYHDISFIIEPLFVKTTTALEKAEQKFNSL